jgi:toxin ParE1/3/4
VAGYRLIRAARRDLVDVWAYIAKDSPLNVDRFLDLIFKRVAMLGSNPYAGRNRDEVKQGLRSFPVGEYLILYIIGKSKVEIVRVVHGRRDLSVLKI